MKLSIIGAGNVATQFALAFKNAGHQILEVYNRNPERGQELAGIAGANFISDLSALRPADVVIVAVKDDAIAEVATAVKVEGSIIAHTSGIQSKELLRDSSTDYGIFYPLQTLTKLSKVDFNNVPILIEGSNNATNAKLKELAGSISQSVYPVDEQQRQWIHLAAVFANNFPNHLFTLAENMLQKRGVSFDILKPLIYRFVENLAQYSPAEIQTGPAVRKDVQTIDRHMQLLADDERLKTIYRVFTESIIAQSAK